MSPAMFSVRSCLMNLMHEIMRWGWLPLVGSLYILDQSMFKLKYFALLGQLGQFVAPEVKFGLLQKLAARQWTVKSGIVYNTFSLVPKEQK